MTEVGTKARLTVVQLAVLVPQAALKRWVGVEAWSEVGRCPWAEQRERGWRWWMTMRGEGEQKQQRLNLFVKKHRLADSETGTQE